MSRIACLSANPAVVLVTQLQFGPSPDLVSTLLVLQEAEAEQPAPRAKRQRTVPARIANSVQPEPSRKRKASMTPPKDSRPTKGRQAARASQSAETNQPAPLPAPEPAVQAPLPQRAPDADEASKTAQAQVPASPAEPHAANNVIKAAQGPHRQQQQRHAASAQMPHTLAHLSDPPAAAPQKALSTSSARARAVGSTQCPQHAQQQALPTGPTGRARHTPSPAPEASHRAQSRGASEPGSTGQAGGAASSAGAARKPGLQPAIQQQPASSGECQRKGPGTRSSAEQPSTSASDLSDSSSAPASGDASEYEELSAEEPELARRGRGRGRGRGRVRGTSPWPACALVHVHASM